VEPLLLIGAILVAGLACPAIMWWQRRRGREAACCASVTGGGEGGEVEALRERQARLAERIAALDRGADRSRSRRSE
jgi:hypothetical protein